jgi:hypothetical protein
MNDIHGWVTKMSMVFMHDLYHLHKSLRKMVLRLDITIGKIPPPGGSLAKRNINNNYATPPSNLM